MNFFQHPSTFLLHVHICSLWVECPLVVPQGKAGLAYSTRPEDVRSAPREHATGRATRKAEAVGRTAGPTRARQPPARRFTAAGSRVDRAVETSGKGRITEDGDGVGETAERGTGSNDERRLESPDGRDFRIFTGTSSDRFSQELGSLVFFFLFPPLLLEYQEQ